VETTLAHYRSRWHLILGVGCSVAILLWVWCNRERAAQAPQLVYSADPLLLAGAVLATMLSYLLSSQVFRIGLARSDVGIGMLHLWAMTLTAIVISQLVPAGGVGSYAFFMSVFKRRGVSTAQAAVLTGLEGLSYVGAMIVWATFSVLYIAIHSFRDGSGSPSLWGLSIAGFVASLVLLSAVYAGTRSTATLTKVALTASTRVFDWLRRPRDDERVRMLVNGFVRERDALMSQRRILASIIVVQLLALAGHSLALWLVLLSLDVNAGFAVAVAAFGTTLILGSFNVLPGGGGTVEAVLAAVLLQFGVGTAAIPAAVLFRVLNYWFLLPVAALAAAWLLRGRAAQTRSRV
jgi:uncharacterized protein (TIRG00374 family)